MHKNHKTRRCVVPRTHRGNIRFYIYFSHVEAILNPNVIESYVNVGFLSVSVATATF